MRLEMEFPSDFDQEHFDHLKESLVECIREHEKRKTLTKQYPTFLEDLLQDPELVKKVRYSFRVESKYLIFNSLCISSILSKEVLQRIINHPLFLYFEQGYVYFKHTDV